MSTNRSGPSRPDSLSATQAEELDRVCDRFEAKWKAGGRPAIGGMKPGRGGMKPGRGSGNRSRHYKTYFIFQLCAYYYTFRTIGFLANQRRNSVLDPWRVSA